MKKAFITLALVIMLTTQGLAAVGAEENSLNNFRKTRNYVNFIFTDITDQWYADYVRVAYQYGIINGVGDSKFNPSGNLTAAEAITIGARIHEVYRYGLEPVYNLFSNNATNASTVI